MLQFGFYGGDTGEQALRAVEERKKRREQADVQESLHKIQERIALALDDYEMSRRSMSSSSAAAGAKTEAELITIDDPQLLYEVLTDARKRQNYRKASTLVIVDYEDRCEERAQILQQVEDFFTESKAGTASKMLDEIQSEQTSLEDGTAEIEDALAVAKNASDKLSSIQTEMVRLLSIYAQFPDTKKGRKKLEKALMKAQEDVQQLTDSLTTSAQELKQLDEVRKELKKTVEAKSTELSRLKKESEKFKQLARTNESLQRDLDDTKATLQKTRGDMESLKKMKMPPKLPLESTVDEGKLKELEATVTALRQEVEEKRSACQELQIQLDGIEECHALQMSTVKQSYEAEIHEMRETFQEQMKSLVDIDIDEEADDGTFSPPMSDDGGSPVVSQPASPSHSTTEVVQASTEEVNDDSPKASGLEQSEADAPVGVEGGGSGSPSSPPATAVKTNPTSAHSSCVSVHSHASSLTVNALTIRHMETYTKEQIDKVKKESSEKEKKLRDEMNDLRNRSKKAVAALRAQLMDTQNRHAMEMETVRRSQVESEEAMEKLKHVCRELEEEVQSKVEEHSEMDQQLQEALQQLEDAREAMSTLQQLVVMQEAEPALVAAKIKELVSRSIQWSTPSASSRVTHLDGCPHGSTMMEGEPPHQGHSLFPSARQSYSPLSPTTTPPLTSMRTTTPPIISMTPVHAMPHIAHGPISLSDSSFQQFLLQESPEGERKGDSPQTIRRHQGQLGPAPVMMQLSRDHPVVQEWVKAYNSVLQFKDHLADIVTEHFSRDLVSALEEVDQVEMQPGSEVQGQITQMRCSLALLLLQMEQVLQGALSQAASVVPQEHDAGSSTAEQNAQLKMTVQNLEEQMAVKDKTHKLEVQQSQEAISQLESTVTSLQKEVTLLRRKAREQSGGADEEIIMFTRLDSERNSQNLKKALQRGSITLPEVEDLQQSMSKYVNLQGRRLSQLVKGVQQRQAHQRMLASLGDGKDKDKLQALKVRANSLHGERQVRWSLEMDKMSLQREKLARSLTERLEGVEAATGVFLIKPVLKKTCPGNVPAPLTTPFYKPLPKHCAVVITSAGTRSETKPKVKVVRIVRPKGPADAQHSRHQKTKLIEALMKRKRVQDSRMHGLVESVVAGGTPPIRQRQQLDQSVPQWKVDAPYIPVESLQPVFPKIVELEASTRRTLPLTRHSNAVQSPPSSILPPILLSGHTL